MATTKVEINEHDISKSVRLELYVNDSNNVITFDTSGALHGIVDFDELIELIDELDEFGVKPNKIEQMREIATEGKKSDETEYSWD